jgi:aminoglycoside phosphotransferase (APT) family kinase protein
MSYVPGVTLAKAWPELQESQKESMSKKLDAIFSDLRQLPRPDKLALGGVAGEGCKDTRRHTRISRMPLYTGAEFWDFQYANAPVGSKVFLEFLRRMTSPFQAQKCVFTHGDIRTANIIVQPDSDGDYQVSGIIDWEMSGFYPEDFEGTKVTNTMASNEKSDWFLHLPSCISPARFPQRWFSDFAWDKQVV